MNDQQEQEYINALRENQLQTESERIKNVQQEVMLNQQESSMIKDQLDLGEELVRIDYLLRGYSLEVDPETNENIWIAPKDNDMVILSPYGVHLIRNTIAWYLNKNTLLSNYDEDTIRHKMEDFATELNKTIFMEYEKVFQYPTFEDCKNVLNKRVEDKTKIRKYAMEILGKKVDEIEEKKIKDDILKQMEPIIEREMEKIKQQLIKNKLKRFMLLIRVVQDAVHSTYNRAYKGQERKTLREHIHISETKGNSFSSGGREGGGFLGFFKRK